MELSSFYEKYLSAVSTVAYHLFQESNYIWKIVPTVNSYSLGYSSFTQAPKINITSGTLINLTGVNQLFTATVDNIDLYTNLRIFIYGSDDNSNFIELFSSPITPTNTSFSINTTRRYLRAVLERNGVILFSTEDLKRGYLPVTSKTHVKIYRKNVSSRLLIGTYPVFIRTSDNSMVVDTSYRDVFSASPAISFEITALIEGILQTYDDRPSILSYVQIGTNKVNMPMPSDYIIPVNNVFAVTNSSLVEQLSLETLTESLVFWGKMKNFLPNGNTNFTNLISFFRTAQKSNGLFYSSYLRETKEVLDTHISTYKNLYLATRLLSTNLPELRELVLTQDIAGRSFVDYILLQVNNLNTSPEYRLIKSGPTDNTYLLRNQVLLYVLYSLLGYVTEANDLKNQVNLKFVNVSAPYIPSLSATYIATSIDHAYAAFWGNLFSNNIMAANAVNTLNSSYKKTNNLGIFLQPNISSPDYNVYYNIPFGRPVSGYKLYQTDNGINTWATFIIGGLLESGLYENLDLMVTKDGVLLTDAGTPAQSTFIFPSLYATLLRINLTLSNNALFVEKGNVSINLSSTPINMNVSQFGTSNGVLLNIELDRPAPIVVYAHSSSGVVYDLKFLQASSTKHIIPLYIPRTTSDVLIQVLPVQL